MQLENVHRSTTKKRAASTQLHDAGYKNEVPNRPTIDSFESRPQIRINSIKFLFHKMNLFKREESSTLQTKTPQTKWKPKFQFRSARFWRTESKNITCGPIESTIRQSNFCSNPPYTSNATEQKQSQTSSPRHLSLSN